MSGSQQAYKQFANELGGYRHLVAGLKHCPMEVIAAAMRKLLHIAYGILKSGRPFDPNYLVKVQAIS
jgi:hypothetical protein